MNHHSHFGVYALIRNEDSILLIKKMRGPYTGMLDLPGGSMEDGELLEDALKREIIEETGCTATKVNQLKAVSALFSYEQGGEPWQLRHIGVIYEAQIQGTPRTDSDGEDAGGCVWVNIQNIPNHSVTPFVKIALELIP